MKINWANVGRGALAAVILAGVWVQYEASKKDTKASAQQVTVSPIQGGIGPAGPAGSPGAAATVSVGTTNTLSPGTGATVTNSGTSSAAVLNFGVPAGQVGATGATGSVGATPNLTIGTITGLTPGTTPTATITGTSANPVLNLGLTVGNTGASGSNGAAGSAASVSIGTTSTLSAGSSATVSNSGTSSAAILNFGIPAGVAGSNGTNGAPGVNAFGALNALSPSLATAYQATDPTKPAFITIGITCTVTVSLGSAQANTIELRTGSTNAVASGGGSQADVFRSDLSVSIVLSLGWTGQQTLRAQLPVGYYWAVRRTNGTSCTITSAFDQTVG